MGDPSCTKGLSLCRKLDGILKSERKKITVASVAWLIIFLDFRTVKSMGMLRQVILGLCVEGGNSSEIIVVTIQIVE